MTATQRPAPASPAGQTQVTDPMPIRVSYRRFAGVRTRVFEVGPPAADADSGRTTRFRRGAPRTASRPTAPRLVLFHGFCDSADTWRPVLTELAKAGVPAMAVDLPGFGEADELRAGAMLPQLDAFAAAVIREQSVLGPVVIAGNSLGGTTTLRAAQNEKLPIAGVVSIAAPGFVDSWVVRAVAKYPIPLRLYSSLPLPVPSFLVKTIAENVVPHFLYANAGSAEKEHVKRFVDLFPDYKSTTVRLEQARQMVAELESAYQLEAISTPLLVVVCGKDKLVSSASGRRLHALVPHSRLLVRQDWGHCPQLDDPAEIAELLTYFAAGVTRATRSDRKLVALPDVIEDQEAVG